MFKGIRKRWNVSELANEARLTNTAVVAADVLSQPQWMPTKRQKLASGSKQMTTSEMNAKVFDLFLETRMTMRESLIRVLEK